MVQRIVTFVSTHRWFFIALVLIECYLFVAVFMPFVATDQLQSWDTAGHLFAASFLQEHLFPNYTGWNPYFYAGYPQDTFYPPLYHYLIAVIGFIIGVGPALKAVTVASVAALPIAFYFFASKAQFGRRESTVMMALMMLPILGYDIHTGGTLYSLFFVGLGANSLALPLLFFYLGMLVAGRHDQRSFMGLTLLLAAIFLTHYVVSIAAVIILLAFVSLHFSWPKVKFLGAHLAVTLLLVGFWLVPFLAFIKYYGGAFIVINISYFITVPILLLLGLSILALFNHPDDRYQFLFFLVVIFGLLVFVDFSQYGLPVHPYRFIIYFLLFAFALLARLFFNHFAQPVKSIAVLCGVGLLMYHVVTIIGPANRYSLNQNHWYQYQNDSIAYQEPLPVPQLRGRVISFAGDVPPHIHDLRAKIAEETGNFQIKGLFIESSANGPFLAGIDANAVRGGFIWGAAPIPLASDDYLTSDANVLQKSFDLFNINYVLMNQKVESTDPQELTLIKDAEPFYLYQVGQSSLIDLVVSPVTAVAKDWDEQVIAWLQTDNRNLLVNAESVPSYVATAQDSVDIIKVSDTQDYLKLHVTAQHPIPILIKISQFPRWHAYVNGEPTPIYRAAPYLMLVYGQGDVELRYENTAWDYLGYILTILGLVILVAHRKLPFLSRFAS